MLTPMDGAVYFGDAIPTAPGYRCSEDRLCRIRTERTVRRLARQIFAGKWKKALVESRRTAHRFPAVTAGEGDGDRVEPLIKKFNVFRLAVKKHADIIANHPATIQVGDDEFVDQIDAIKHIRRRCAWDANLHQAIRKACIEGYAVLITDHCDDGCTWHAGVVIRVGSGDEWIPVGDDGPEQQPKVWERRWIVERKREGQKRGDRYLRVERRHAPGGVQTVEQEAYRLKDDGCDVLLDLAELERVPLGQAFEPGAAVPPDSRPTGTTYPTIVRLPRDLYDDRAEGMLGDCDVDLIDEIMAGLSRLSRVMAMHGTPKMRISESQIDAKTGKARITLDAVVDPDKINEYITVQAEFDALMDVLDRVIEWSLVDFEISPGLLGVKTRGGAAPETYERLLLESINTLGAAERAKPLCQDPLEYIWTAACELASSRPAEGWPVAYVNVELHPELPKDKTQTAREQGELKSFGLTSEYDALVAIHGESNAPAIYERIQEERDRESKRQQRALFGAVMPERSPPLEPPAAADEEPVEENAA